ncbi:hypothetical protein O9992_01120 [Vibrio lentus]|nr:hypothetical protein [Vibrio lentus]
MTAKFEHLINLTTVAGSNLASTEVSCSSLFKVTLALEPNRNLDHATGEDIIEVDCGELNDLDNSCSDINSNTDYYRW